MALAGDDLRRCDGYVLVVADPVTRTVECYGPYGDLSTARSALEDACAGLVTTEIRDVVLALARWHGPS